MFVQRSATVITKFVKQFVQNLLELNWNDHLLAEIGTTRPSRKREENSNNEM